MAPLENQQYSRLSNNPTGFRAVIADIDANKYCFLMFENTLVIENIIPVFCLFSSLT
jgi:hypothetical protein